MDFYDRQNRKPIAGEDTSRTLLAAPPAADGGSGARAAGAPPRSIVLTPDAIIGVVGALLVIIGSFGPWAKIGAATATGVTGDGAFSVVAGFLLLGLVALGRWPGLAAASALVAGAVGLYDAVAIGGVADVEDAVALSVSVGWGVILTAAGGILGLGWALYRVTLDNPTAALIAGLLSALVLICAVALGSGTGVSSITGPDGTEYTDDRDNGNGLPDPADGETFPGVN